MAVPLDAVLEAFNHGFRVGANSRSSDGHAPGTQARTTPWIPPVPDKIGIDGLSEAWREGFVLGYQIGASDGELTSSRTPGAVGMISSLSLDMMRLFSVLKRLGLE